MVRIVQCLKDNLARLLNELRVARGPNTCSGNFTWNITTTTIRIPYYS